MVLTYIVIFILLLLCELVYFHIADKYNIIDKPNERSSHSSIVLRGGGIVFLIGIWVWSVFFGFAYPWFLVAITLIAAISFIDDIHSLQDGVRLVVQFIAMTMMLYQLDIIHLELWWAAILALVVCVGATNVVNFMDGINGITGSYSMSVLFPLLLLNGHNQFIEESYLVVTILSVLVFLLFNFRNRGKAKCFAGDVGSISIAFIMLFAIGKLVMATEDITWLIFLLVYGVDGCLTICHRILLHENLGKAHRKHVYQLMANELRLSHPLVSLIYTIIQFVISIGFIYVSPLLASSLGYSIMVIHWIYLIVVAVILAVFYILFKKKYYHLHEEYLRSREA